MAMFYRTEQLNSAFSCNTTPTWRRSCVASAVAMSCPSTSTRPDYGAYSRYSSLVSVLCSSRCAPPATKLRFAPP